jgi:hypothetical protein
MGKTFKAGEIVTVKYENVVSSNTYVVESDCGDSVLLFHPLFPHCLMRHGKDQLDLVSPNVKDSIERSLDFVNKNTRYLDYNTLADHEALCAYFVLRRRLTPRQKNMLSNMCGTVASSVLNNDVKLAIDLVTSNAAVLDDFNLMWYRNFNRLFLGEQPITSVKQRAAIFNMAGFVMAELERPTVPNKV